MLRICLLFLAIAMPGIGSAQNAEVPPERPFTLLLITADGGTSHFSQDVRDSLIRRMVFAPTSQQMQRWSAWATPKELAANSPIVREKHMDIIRDAGTLPALALVDSINGSRWHLMSGNALPSTEYELARVLDVYFAATMQAAKQMPAQAIQSVNRQQYDQFKTSQYMTRDVGGPTPFVNQPIVAPGGGILNPQINLPNNFDFNADASVNTQVDPTTRSWATKIVFAGCCVAVLMAAAFIFGCWIIAEGMTEDRPQP